MAKDDGDSALRLTWNFETVENGVNTGMTLRDYFAAKAMQAFCTGCNDVEGYSDTGLAIMAYQMADAMLKERNK
jgi:hypothetical protein